MFLLINCEYLVLFFEVLINVFLIKDGLFFLFLRIWFILSCKFWGRDINLDNSILFVRFWWYLLELKCSWL